MTGVEWENFEKLNDQKYILVKNKVFMRDYQQKFKEITLDLNEIQTLINWLTQFFEFKYPEEVLNKIRENPEADNIYECMNISKKLDIKQLKVRLTASQLRFLECEYTSYIQIKREKRNLWQLSSLMIRVDKQGKINPYDLEALKEEEFLTDIDGVTRVEDLLGRFMGIETDVDYHDLEKTVKNHKYNVSLRKQVLELTMLSLFYSNHPKNGYIRAKGLMRMFNKEYDIKLNMEEIDQLMEIDYSNTSEIDERIREKKKIKGKNK